MTPLLSTRNVRFPEFVPTRCLSGYGPNLVIGFPHSECPGSVRSGCPFETLSFTGSSQLGAKFRVRA